DPFPSLPNNTVINNTAHIFFDFNPAVVTNTVSNTLVDTIPHYSTTQNINLTCGSTYTFPDGTLMNDIIANISHISHLSSVVSCDSIITTTVSVDPIDLTVTQSIFTLTAAATATAYQWIDCNAGNAPITGETNQSFIATSDGDYAVVITNGSCSDTSACYNITGTGIGNPAQNNFISIYPNPATNSITISTKEVAEKIMVLDVYGRVLKTLTPLQHNTTLSISELENAVYVVNVSGSNFSHSTRFVKQ
ncbi:MAG TPA: T9SS type A sorting domain-containing protein, partial [Flavobacteriales bacterium]|nr:T9SS type A sorting domain-containing protein [Flavobacteriales bacterium]